MSSFQRISQFLQGLFMLLCAFIITFAPGDRGVRVAAIVIGFILIIYGLRKLFYYLTMARHMVGGNTMLFVGVIAIDLGAFVLTMVDQPQFAVVLYLVGINGYMGLVGMLRSIERKKVGAMWIPSMINAVARLLFALACVVFAYSGDFLLAILGLGLFISAIGHLSTAFRKTDVIFIQ